MENIKAKTTMADGKELINYKNELETALKQQFDDLTVLVFEDMDENTELPAIVVDKPILETIFQQVATKSNFMTKMSISVYIVYSATDSDSNIKSMQKAANVGKFIHGSLFGLRNPARVIDIMPAVVDGLDAFDIQRVAFEQNISIISDK